MELKELFATFGLDFDEAGFAQAEGALEKLKVVARSFGAVLVSGAVLGALTSFVSGVVHASTEIDALSRRAGVSSTVLQQWSAALAPLGLNLEATSKAFEELNIKAGEAARGEGAADIFRSLGVDVRDASGAVRSGSDLLLDVTDRVAALGSASERAAYLNQLMGEEGRRLGPAFANGANGIRDLVTQLGDLGYLSEETIEQSRALAGQFAILDAATTSLRNELARVLLPVATEVVETVVKWSRGLVSAVRQSNAFKAAIVVLGGALVTWGVATVSAWGPALLAFLGVAAAIGAVVLIVDDLITMFEGGESALGSWIDANYGAGTAARWVEDAKHGWNGLKMAMSQAWEDFSRGATDYSDFLFRLSNATKQTVRDIGQWFTDLGQSIVDTFDRVTGRVSEAFEFIGETWGEIFSDLGESFRSQGRFAAGQARGITGSGPATATAPAAPRATSTATVTNNSPVNITVQGNPSRDELRRIQAAVDETLDRRNREAAAALTPVPV